MESLKKILVFRFSAMGDVALLLPVVKAVVAANPDVEITVVTRPKFASFFTDIDRVVPFPADVDFTYNGPLGLRDLFGKLIRRGTYDAVIDVHDSVRTKILRFLFRIFGVPVYIISKGKKEKEALVHPTKKVRGQLKHTVDRYLDTFKAAGFNGVVSSAPYLHIRPEIEADANNWVNRMALVKNEKWIGIAPFAKHLSKVWPLEKYADVIKTLSAREPVKFFLFGGGETEIKALTRFAEKFPDNVVVVAGQLKIKQELSFMKRMDLMICVDSSNMHLAVLLNIPVVSVWGGTHTDAGFGPYGLGPESVVEVSVTDVACRPCSVYGTSKCARKDFACLNTLTSGMITDRIISRGIIN